MEIYLTAADGVSKIMDNNDNEIKVTDNGYEASNGKGITFTRDEEDRIIQAEDPNGNITAYTYDDCGNLSTVTDPAGRKVSFTYDKKHNLISIIDPMGIATARNEYDETGRLVAVMDADGNRMEYDYDMEGRTQTIRDRRGNSTVYTYDEKGSLIKQTGDQTIDYRYDLEGHLLRATVQKGNDVTIESYTYDYAGNRTSKTEGDKESVYYVVDTSTGLAQVTAETDREGKEKAYYTRGEELISLERNNQLWYYTYYLGKGGKMIIGDPDIFAIVADVVESWNSDKSFNNGLLFLSINGVFFPKEIIDSTLNTEVYELIKNLENIKENINLFQMSKEEAFVYIYKLIFPEDYNVDSDYSYNITPFVLWDNSYYVFMVSKDGENRILASKLQYLKEECVHNLQELEVIETYISAEKLQEMLEKLKLFQMQILEL